MELKQKYVQWFCGFYEGEGYVSNDKSNNNRLRLGIAQNDSKPLELAKSIWGGTILKRVRKSPCSEKICTGYEWRLCHNDAKIFLDDIKPYLIIPYKIQQIQIACKKAELGNHVRYKCSKCDDDFASPSGRRRHYKNFHENTDASFVVSSEAIKQDNQIAGNP